MIRRPPRSPLFPTRRSPDPDLGAAVDYGAVARRIVEIGTGQRVNLIRSEEHTSELQSRLHLVCRLLLEKKKYYHSHQRVTSSVYISSARPSTEHPSMTSFAA